MKSTEVGEMKSKKMVCRGRRYPRESRVWIEGRGNQYITLINSIHVHVHVYSKPF